MFNVIQNHGELIGWLGLASIVMLLTTAFLGGWFLVQLPADYFSAPASRSAAWSKRHPALRVFFVAAKNVVGLVLVLIGIAMLVLPGQGLLSILVGVMLLDFPGKYRLERRIVGKPSVLRSINWLRHRANKSPFILDESESP